MATKTLSEIQSDYFTSLAAASPQLNVNDPNSDFVIRGNVLCGLVSGVYSDLDSVEGDTFVQTARAPALYLIGASLGLTPQPPTPSTSPGAVITGTPGTVVSNALNLLYPPTGVSYVTNTVPFTIGSNGTATVSITSQVTGQITNVAAPDTLLLTSVVTGLQPSVSLTTSLTDGNDQESVDSFRARVLSRLQTPPSGGNVSDYSTFAYAGDPTVRSATVTRFPLGLGTVGVTITVGSSDINSAINAGEPINPIPSNSTISAVQSYINQQAPLTDCAIVSGPSTVNVNVSMSVSLAANTTLSTVPTNSTYNALNLTVSQLIQREVQRAIYLLPVGGTTVPSKTGGFLFASLVEYYLDAMLSANVPSGQTTPLGNIPVLLDRVVTFPNQTSITSIPLSVGQIAIPATITIGLN